MNRDEMTDTRGAASAVDRLRETGRETFEDVKGRAVDAATRTASAAKAEAMDRAEMAKDTLADEGRRIADSLRSSADDGSVQAKVLGVVADSVADLSDSLRGRSFSDLLTEAEGFARRNPGAFVAAAALAGFALARFARASTPEPDYAAGTGYGDGMGAGGMGGGMGTGSMGGSFAGGVGASSMGMDSGGMSDGGMDDAGLDVGGMNMGSGLGVDADDREGAPSTGPGSFGSGAL